MARGQVLGQMAAGVAYVRSHSVFSFILLLTFCNNMFGMAYIHLMPVFAKEVLDVGAERISCLFGAVGVGAILGTAIVGSLKDKNPIGFVILGGAILYGVGLILFAWAASQQAYWASMAILAGTGVAHTLYITGGLVVLQNLVPDQLWGRTMGLYGITWSLGPLSMAYGGPVADWLDAPWAVATGQGQRQRGWCTYGSFAGVDIEPRRPDWNRGSFSSTVLIVGAHTITLTAQDSDGATATDTVTIMVELPNQAPVAAITSPADGATVTEGDSVAFEGTVSDVEDGTITAGLSWSSTIDGPIGTGAGFSSADLSVGTHTITLTAVDSHGATGSDSITLTVDPAGNPIEVAFVSIAAEDGWVRK